MIIAISDLHLGDKGPRDNFIVRGEGRLYRFLDFVADNDARLVILGDLLETWQCNFGRIIKAYDQLLRRLVDFDPYYIQGNHDNLLEPLIGTKYMPNIPVIEDQNGPYFPTINGKKFHFCHGHEGDQTCNSLNPGVGVITAVASGLLEDRNNSPDYRGAVIEDKFISTLEFVLNAWRLLSFTERRDVELLRGLEEYRQSQCADVLIAGHTHQPGSIGTHYYNTGCWCRDLDTFASVGEDGEVRLFVWDGYKPVPFTKELQ